MKSGKSTQTLPSGFLDFELRVLALSTPSFFWDRWRRFFIRLFGFLLELHLKFLNSYFLQMSLRSGSGSHYDNFHAGLRINRGYLHGLSDLLVFNIDFLARICAVVLVRTIVWLIRRHVASPSLPITDSTR